MQPLYSPSHHEHHTIVFPTRYPTWWCWFYCDRMSLIRMISYHGYQNYLPPPTSKPSCDRYSQPPKIKPTPPCSPDDALPAHIISWPVKQISLLGNCRIFNKIFHFPKRRAKPLKREVHLLESDFSETCRHVISFFKSQKRGTLGSSLTTTPSWRPRGRCRVGEGGEWRRVEVIWVDGRARGELAPFVFIFPSHLPFLGFPLTTS